MRHCIVDHGHHFDLGDLSGLDDSAQGNDGNQADLAEHCNCNIVDYGHHFDLGDMMILVIMLVVILVTVVMVAKMKIKYLVSRRFHSHLRLVLYLHPKSCWKSGEHGARPILVEH